jgi:ABC-type nitrate/sulfonate/bicarbonate transport system substrate-binding protein
MSIMPKSPPTHLTRRSFLTAAAASAAGFASLSLLRAQTSPGKGTQQPVKIGYLAITDSTPLLIAHANKLYEAEGLKAEQPYFSGPGHKFRRPSLPGKSMLSIY